MGPLVIAVLTILLSSNSTWAHASLLGTTPADGEQLDSSPVEIVLEFSEPVGIVEGGTVLHGSGSESMSLSPVARGSSVVVPLDESLDTGAYILQWRVISADSHPVSGTVSFTVGDADFDAVGTVTSETPDWVEWGRSAAVAVKYIGLLAAFGVLLVGTQLIRGDYLPSIQIASWFAVFGCIGILAELPFSAMVQRGEVITSVTDIWAGISGLDSGTRLAAVVGLVAGGIVVLGRGVFRGWIVPLSLTAIAVLSLLLSGHTRSQQPIWLMMISDAVHVITAAVWLGGIVLLTLGLRGGWKGEGFASAQLRFEAVSRFSALAGWTAVCVILSGISMALVILDSLDALFETRYGITLLIKIVLVMVVLLLAAANRYWLIPRREQDADFSLTWLQRLVSIELVVLITIAGVTGSLVHLDPNVQANEEIVQDYSRVVFEDESELDDQHVVRLTISTNSRNEVTIVATIIDTDRNIVLPDANLQLTWYLPDRDLGPLGQELFLDTATGAYIGSYSLPAPGEWELGIQVRIDRFTDSRTTINVVIPD